MTARQVTRVRKGGKIEKTWIIQIKGLRSPDGTLYPEIKHKSPLQSATGARHYDQQVVQAVLLGKYDFKRNSLRGEAEDEPTEVKAPESTVPTLSAFQDAFLEWCRLDKRRKPTYVETHESSLRAHLLPLFGDRRLDTFNPDDETTLKRRLVDRVCKDGSKKSDARSTYNNQATTINMLLKCAVLKKQLPALPYKFTVFKREETHAHYYDFDEYEFIVEAARQISARTHLIVLLGGDAGLRRGEILALDRLRVDFRAGTLNIEVAVSVVKIDGRYQAVEHATKGWERRSVPVTDRLMAALLAYPRDARGPKLFYPDGDVAFITDKVFKQWMAEAQRAVKTPEGGLAHANGEVHIFRHTFCSHLAMRGASLSAIRELAGHQKISTTQKYMHLARGEKHRAIGLLNNRSEWVDELLSGRTRRPLPSGADDERSS
jgi:integrase